MEAFEFIENIETKEDFIDFLKELQDDYHANLDGWENPDLPRYLEAMEAFLTSSTEQSLVKVDFTPSWKLFAQIMLTASIYE